MQFVFDERKTAQAASHLIHLAGGSLNYMVLIKLLYYSDRRSLIERGVPITGDRPVSMDNGPVLSKTYEMISMGPPNDHGLGLPVIGRGRHWYERISEPEKYEVHLNAEPADLDELSPYELKVLAETFGQYGHWNKWRLVEETHKLPEWHDPNGSMIPIEYEDILRAGGRTEDEIAALSDEAEHLWYLRTRSA